MNSEWAVSNGNALWPVGSHGKRNGIETRDCQRAPATRSSVKSGESSMSDDTTPLNYGGRVVPHFVTAPELYFIFSIASESVPLVAHETPAQFHNSNFCLAYQLSE